MLLPDLEAIERVMVEKKGANLKAKGKGSTAPSEAKGNLKRKASRLVESLRRVTVRSFASIARPTAVPLQPTTPWTAIAMTAMVSPLRQQQVSPLSPRSPTISLRAIRA